MAGGGPPQPCTDPAFTRTLPLAAPAAEGGYWAPRHVWRFYKMYLLFLDILLKYFLPPWDHRENYSVFFKFRKMG